jgi:hypothetical protein
MSLRRVDVAAEDASASLSIGAAIGALADRLPVATRLNHVLAVGAKLKLERQRSLSSSMRKPVNTDAWDRGGRWHDWQSNGYKFKGINVLQRLPAYQQALGDVATSPQNQRFVQDAGIEITNLGQVAQTIEDLDYLRQVDAYAALLWIVHHTTPGTQRHDQAKMMIRESLYHDKENQAGIANKAWQQLMFCNQYLGLQFNILNYPQLTPKELKMLHAAVMDRHIERMQRSSQVVLDQEQAQDNAALLSQNPWTLQHNMYG